MYWFPHTDRMLTKRNNRTAGEAPAPLSRCAGLARRRAARQPRLRLRPTGSATSRPRSIPTLNRRRSRALSARTLQRRLAQGVLTSSRRVRFREMEYAVPREAGDGGAHRGPRADRAQRLADRLPGGDPAAPRPTTSGCRRRTRATSVYLAFHTNARTDHTDVLRGGRASVLRATTAARTGASCTPGPPRTSRRPTRASADFLALRDRLDPDRLFTNAYLERVLTPSTMRRPTPDTPGPARSPSGTTRARRGSSAPPSAIEVVLGGVGHRPHERRAAGAGDQPPADVLPAVPSLRSRARCVRRRVARCASGRAGRRTSTWSAATGRRAGRLVLPVADRGVRGDRRPRGALPRR